MKKNSKTIGFVSLFITYLVVKVVHSFAGFHFDPFSEGIFNIKFLIDIKSWGIISTMVYFLMKRLLPQKSI